MTWTWSLNGDSTSAEASVTLTTDFKRTSVPPATNTNPLQCCGDSQQHSSASSCSGHQTSNTSANAGQVATLGIVPTLSSGCWSREMSTGRKIREHCWGYDCPTHCAQGSWGATATIKTCCRCAGPQRRQGTTYQAFPVNLSLCKHLFCNTVLCQPLGGKQKPVVQWDHWHRTLHQGVHNKAVKHTSG